MTPAQLLLATAQQWHAQGRAAVVVQVQAHRGSVPRETGTRMLVSADEVVGTIGGGHLELQAIATAREQLNARMAPSPSGDRQQDPEYGDGPSLVQRIALGPSLGQCCGGALDLSFTPLDACDPQAWGQPSPLFTLQLYGAGHVGRAIVRLLAGINCRVQWIDERESEFPAEASPAHIQRVCVEPVEAEVALAPAGAFYLVLTHSHDLDLAITQAVLARGDFGYFGLIGSATKRARFEHRLQQRGLAPALLQRMVCPIGVTGITGKDPEVIAVGVVAQLLQAASAAGRSAD
jgi:xanthine dehydrogenase accessory factor